MPPLYIPHGETHAKVVTWLELYAEATPGVRVLDNATLLLDDDGEPQPDACAFIPAEHGGQTWVEDDCLAGGPELVVEVAYSSDSHDLHSKKSDYERAGVREYLVVVLREPRVVWFVRRNERFEEVPPGADGVLRSEVFPGLWLEPTALLRRELKGIRAALERGLATPDHAEFVRRLGG